MAETYTVRPASFTDAKAVFDLIKRFPETVLPRPIGDIVGNTDRFLVAESNGRIGGIISWQILPEIGLKKRPSVELKSLAVAEDLQGSGLGKRLVMEAIGRIKSLDPAEILVLTFTPDFFRSLGFNEVPKEDHMHKLYAGCVNCSRYDSPFTCPEVAMALNPRRSNPSQSPPDTSDL